MSAVVKVWTTDVARLHLHKVEDAFVCVCVFFWVQDRVLGGDGGEKGGRVVCTYAKSVVLPHLCAKQCSCVCVCVCVARRLLSSRVRRAGKLARHADRLKCYSLPEVRSAPRKFVILFHLSDSRTVGVRGSVFVLICCWRLNTHTLVCNRPVKVTKKFVWPCCEILLSALPLSAMGQKWAKQLFCHSWQHILHPSTNSLACSAFCQISILSHSFSQSKSAYHLPWLSSTTGSTPRYLWNLISLCTFSSSYLYTLQPPLISLPSSNQQYPPKTYSSATLGEALVIPSELNTFSFAG